MLETADMGYQPEGAVCYVFHDVADQHARRGEIPGQILHPATPQGVSQTV